MRTIKFRGQKANTNEWVYGDLLHISGGCIIYHGSQTECENKENVGAALELFADEFSVVIPETVGQSICLFDKNDKEIYEGDIVNFTRSIGDWLSGIGYRQLTTKHTIVWDNDVSRFGLTINSSDTMKFREHPRYIYEVVGNIFDVE